MIRHEYRYFRGVESYLLRILWLASGRQWPARARVIHPKKNAATEPTADADDEPDTPVRVRSIPLRAVGILVAAATRTFVLALIVAFSVFLGLVSYGPLDPAESWLPALFTTAAVMTAVTIALAIRQAVKERRGT